jgi:glycosyltransferase involved in cell wall biosynthesis
MTVRSAMHRVDVSFGATNLNFCGNFNATGVGRHTEGAFLGASRTRPEGVNIRYVNFGRQSSVRRLICDARARTDTTVFFWRQPPELLQQVRGCRVGWLFFESDKVPEPWLQQMDAFDRLWMPSEWGRDVLVAHGLPEAKIRVVESGINERIYFPKPVAHSGFVFLFIGKHEPRKSLEETVSAFVEEFPADACPTVQLWIKADHPVFPQRVARLRVQYGHERRIRFISGLLSDEQMASLYNSADAFVYPTKAEGFGLPCIEALACGLPVITTEYSAQTAFLKHVRGLYYPVQFDVAELDDEDYAYFYSRDYGGHGYGHWAVPKIESVRHGMRDIYENIGQWRERARQASRIIHENFSWDRIGRKAVDTALAG